MAKVAVTGATGFLGSHIADELRHRGDEVVAVVRSPHKADELVAQGVEVRQADLLDVDALRAGFGGVDAVVANAAMLTGSGGTLDEFIEANRTGTANQLDAAEAAGVRRIIYISTVAVYQTSLRRVISEDHPRVGGSRFDWSWLVSSKNYSVSKALAEEQVWEAAARGFEVTVLRPGPIYGPNGGRLTARYIQALARPVVALPTVRIPHVHARDVAAAVSGALRSEASHGKAYNVTGPSMSLFHVMRAIKAATGTGPVLVPIPLPFWVEYDNSGAERDLDFEARSVVEGVQAALGL